MRLVALYCSAPKGCVHQFEAAVVVEIAGTVSSCHSVGRMGFQVQFVGVGSYSVAADNSVAVVGIEIGRNRFAVLGSRFGSLSVAAVESL